MASYQILTIYIKLTKEAGFMAFYFIVKHFIEPKYVRVLQHGSSGGSGGGGVSGGGIVRS